MNIRRVVGVVVAAGVIVASVFVVDGLRADPETPPLRLERGDRPSPVPEEAAKVLNLLSDAFAAVAEDTKPYVVSITTETQIAASDPTERFPGLREFFGDRFFERRREGFRQRGLGSGVIVSPDGYILTNNHVAGEADELKVRLSDGRAFDAKLIGADAESDIAVIKIDADKDLPAAVLGDSERLRVGDWVIAVGSPFHLEQTVTAGIVSAKGRSGVQLTAYEDFIQTDAAINPGNSGGPLVDLSGKVIGINTAIATRSGGYQGIGFAIPANMAASIMGDLINEGRVIRGWLGVVINNIDDDMAESLGLDRAYGALIEDVDQRGPSKNAGLEPGDVIVKFEGFVIRDTDDLRNRVAMTRPGTDVEVVVAREGSDRKFRVRLEERPEDLALVTSRTEDDRFGMQLRDLDADIAESLGTELGTGGVVVESVERGSQAEEKGIRRGDIIREMGREPLRTVTQYQDRLGGLESKETVLLLIERDGRTRFFALRKP